MAKWMEFGIADGDVWLDPIVVPVSSQQQACQGCTNFTLMFNDAFPGTMSTCGLSNVSNGAPEHLRAVLNQTYITMLRKDGNMKAAILDGFDKRMFDFVRGRVPEVEKLVWGMMDGNTPDPGSLSTELVPYFKTTRVLLGQTLYSDSWLEL
jgi:5-methyltetrahydrofolate corrinoid/iron sulfur protein methyltransferase